jgi:hypothetical protein
VVDRILSCGVYALFSAEVYKNPLFLFRNSMLWLAIYANGIIENASHEVLGGVDEIQQIEPDVR